MSMALTMGAAAQIESHSDGSDGNFFPSPNTVIDLSQAATGSWNDASPVMGQGVYDPEQWVVVFKYQNVNILNTVNVSFLPHPSGAPVVWLVQNDAIINGVVDLRGEDGFAAATPFTYTKPGPGGFRGGSGLVGGQPASSGFGPGGGIPGTPAAPGMFDYGNAQIMPLVGGSGGGGAAISERVGGAGGGAILIVAGNSIAVNGEINARGGARFGGGTNYSGAGSGGAIRLIADQITGGGNLIATGGTGSSAASDGRIRLEANEFNSFNIVSTPNASIGGPGPIIKDPNRPEIRIVAINGLPVPQDPTADINITDFVVPGEDIWVEVEAKNVPPNLFATIEIRPAHGPIITKPVFLTGTFDQSSGTSLPEPLPNYPADIQVIVEWTP
jgi:hypothetical protein